MVPGKPRAFAGCGGVALTPSTGGHPYSRDAFGSWRAGRRASLFPELRLGGEPKLEIAVRGRTGFGPELARTRGDFFVTEEGIIRIGTHKAGDVAILALQQGLGAVDEHLGASDVTG